jgi:hypothetical protein
LVYLIRKHSIGILLCSWGLSIVILFFAGLIASSSLYNEIDLSTNLLWSAGLLLAVPILLFFGGFCFWSLYHWIDHQVWVYRNWKSRFTSSTEKDEQ